MPLLSHIGSTQVRYSLRIGARSCSLGRCQPRTTRSIFSEGTGVPRPITSLHAPSQAAGRPRRRHIAPQNDVSGERTASVTWQVEVVIHATAGDDLADMGLELTVISLDGTKSKTFPLDMAAGGPEADEAYEAYKDYRLRSEPQDRSGSFAVELALGFEPAAIMIRDLEDKGATIFQKNGTYERLFLKQLVLMPIGSESKVVHFMANSYISTEQGDRLFVRDDAWTSQELRSNEVIAKLQEEQLLEMRVADGVALLYQPPEGTTPEVDIVLFPGLQATNNPDAWRDTWLNSSGVLWPRVFLGQDFPTARILSVFYDLPPVPSSIAATVMAESLASTLCWQLEVGKDRPVILVGHSLGGIVMKHVVLQAAKAAQQPDTACCCATYIREACASFTSNLSGFFFYATPHGGWHLSDSSFSGSLFAAESVAEHLKVLSKDVALVNSQFSLFVGGRPSLKPTAVCETEKLQGVLVVEEASAKQGMSSAFPLPEDHISICHPLNRRSGSYLHLKQYVAECVPHCVPSGSRLLGGYGGGYGMHEHGLLGSMGSFGDGDDDGDEGAAQAGSVAAAVVPGVYGKSSLGWFDETFLRFAAATVSWEVFWEQLERVVHDRHLGAERWSYLEHRLHHAQQRHKFQEIVSSSSSHVSREEFSIVTDLTPGRTLAEVINLIMGSKWSDWYGRETDDQAPCSTITRAVQAPAGQWITKWSLGIARLPITAEDGSTQKESVIVSLQGRTQATWLEVVRKEGQRVKVEVDVPDGDSIRGEGFAVLRGRGNSSRLVSLEGAPDAGEGSCWTVTGEKLTGPGSKVVGYQLCVVNVGAASGYVDSARFLFRSFAPPAPSTSLLDAVFISHTGGDQHAVDFAVYLHGQLMNRGIAAFMDDQTMHGGMDWSQVITTWAVRSKVFIAVLSPKFPTRKWPLCELHLARHHRLQQHAKTIPVLFGVSRSDLEQPGSSEVSETWPGVWEKLFAGGPVAVGDLQLSPDPAAELKQLLKHGQTTDGANFGIATSKAGHARLADEVVRIVRNFM